MSVLVRETINHFLMYITIKFTYSHHSDMLNLTSRIAQNWPDWDINWNDSRPQKPRSDLTCSDFLPDDNDAHALQKHVM